RLSALAWLAGRQGQGKQQAAGDMNRKSRCHVRVSTCRQDSDYGILRHCDHEWPGLGKTMVNSEIVRCDWCGDDPLYCRYHDEEWGVPVHDEQRLFEFLALEGAQAGLAWITILRKREGYRHAFSQFDPVAVARYGPGQVERLV